MSNSVQYTPGPAYADVRKDEGENWTLVLVREFHHSPEKVWQALTDPQHLHEWAPFDANASLGKTGATVTLTTFGAPQENIVETTIARADAPKLLEYSWGGGDMRWELEPQGNGTRLTLLAKINRNYVAMGAAGWQICLDVLDLHLEGTPIGRMAGMETMKFEGWQRLNGEYMQRFGVEPPKWG